MGAGGGTRGGSPRTSAAHPLEARPEGAGVSIASLASLETPAPRQGPEGNDHDGGAGAPDHKQITVHFNADLSENLL